MNLNGICEFEDEFTFNDEGELLIPETFPDVEGWSITPLGKTKVYR